MVDLTKDITTKIYMNFDLDLGIKVIPNLIGWSNWLSRSGVKDEVAIKIVSLDFFHPIGFWLNILYSSLDLNILYSSLDFFSPNRLLVEHIIFRSLGSNGKRKNQIIIKVTTVKHSGSETMDRSQTFSRGLLQTGCLWQKLKPPFAEITVIIHVF